jgi:hypothetical protein
LLVLESCSKRSYLKPAEDGYSPEELASVFSRSVFWWLNPILLRGNRKILALEDLYPLNHILESGSLKGRIVRSWEKRMNHLQKESKLTNADGSSSAYSFLTANIACFKWEALRTIPPRLGITGFTYAQTFLITAAINYLELPAGLRNKNHAYGLIGATALIYCGIAVAAKDLPT